MILPLHTPSAICRLLRLGALFAATSGGLVHAEVSLPGIFTDNMVLQQRTNANIWGWAAPGESVRVTGSWNGHSVTATADSNGDWQVALPTPAATINATPYQVTVAGNGNVVTLDNVLIGEVWLLSGQSNMEMALRGWPEAEVPVTIEGGEEAIESADYPAIRVMIVARQAAAEPAEDIIRSHLLGTWTPSEPATIHDFSAVGFFFGRHLHEWLGIPIGLIQVTRGGSPAEAWTPREDLEQFPAYAAGPWTPESVTDRTIPASLYNGMIAPVAPFSIRGVLWYQGENNVGRAEEYARLFPTLINAWRRTWNQADLPFYFVQIAPYRHYPTRTGLMEMWEAQGSALNLPNTGMAVAIDAGNTEDIHPGIKKPLADRLALLARQQVYGESLTGSSPLYAGKQVEGATLRLFFNHAQDGLTVSNDPSISFQVAGPDGVYYPADVQVEGTTLLVSSPQVPTPLHARYAWKDQPVPTFFSSTGLPAAPFRTDVPSYLPSVYGASQPAEQWANLHIFNGTHVRVGNKLNWLDIRARPWMFSHSLDRWIFIPEELMASEGTWIFFPRDNAPEETSNPSWAGYPKDNEGYAHAKDFLGWVWEERDGPWIYSFAFNTWIYFPEAAVQSYGGWAYLLR